MDFIARGRRLFRLPAYLPGYLGHRPWSPPMFYFSLVSDSFLRGSPQTSHHLGANQCFNFSFGKLGGGVSPSVVFIMLGYHCQRIKAQHLPIRCRAVSLVLADSAATRLPSQQLLFRRCSRQHSNLQFCRNLSDLLLQILPRAKENRKRVMEERWHPLCPRDSRYNSTNAPFMAHCPQLL